jgi:WD40 repeat protein
MQQTYHCFSAFLILATISPNIETTGKQVLPRIQPSSRFSLKFGTLTQVALSPNGELAAVTASNGIFIYRIGEQHHFCHYPVLLKHSAKGAFFYDNQTYAYLEVTESAALFDLVNNHLFKRLTLKTDMSSIAVSPDGKTIALGSYDGLVSIVEISTGRVGE